MATTMLRRLPGGTPFADAYNEWVDVALGNLGARLRLDGYDGVEKNPIGGATLTTGNYSQWIRNTAGNHLQVRNSSNLSNALLVQDNAITPGAPIIPDASNTWDLGTTGTRWRTGYFAGSPPFVVTSTTEVANLNASRVAGKIPTATPAAGALPLADGSGTLNSWVTTTFVGGTLTGPLLLADGSSGAPSLAFANDADSGWKKGSTSNTIVMPLGATDQFWFQDSGTVPHFGVGLAPSVPLHVSATKAANFVSVLNNASATGQGLQITLTSTSASDPILDLVSASTRRVAVWADGGMTVGNPASGNKGAGSINAGAVYDDGVGPLTDWIFDLAYDGLVRPEDDGAHIRPLLTIRETEAFAREHRHLPHIPGREAWRRNGETFSLGALVHALWETAERQALHIFELNTRLAALERRVA